MYQPCWHVGTDPSTSARCAQPGIDEPARFRLLHHAQEVVTDGTSYRMRQARAKKGTTPKRTNQPEGWGLLPGHQWGPQLGR